MRSPRHRSPTRRLSRQPYPRLAGCALLALLAAALVVYATAIYARATREHVQIAFAQEGLETPGLLQVYVDCAGPYGPGSPPASGVLDLGWLYPWELVTVQARFGKDRVRLHYEVIVNGQRQAIYKSKGAHDDRLKGIRGDWLVHRTYTAAGREAVKAGCATAGRTPPLALSDPAARAGAWNEEAFTAATAAAPWLLDLYYIAGIAIVLGVVVVQAVALALMPGKVWPIFAVFTGVLLALGAAAHELALPWPKPVIAAATALLSVFVGSYWLRHDIAWVAQALRRAAALLLPLDRPKPPPSPE